MNITEFFVFCVEKDAHNETLVVSAVILLYACMRTFVGLTRTLCNIALFIFCVKQTPICSVCKGAVLNFQNRYFFQLNPYLRGLERDQELRHDSSKK